MNIFPASAANAGIWECTVTFNGMTGTLKSSSATVTVSGIISLGRIVLRQSIEYGILLEVRTQCFLPSDWSNPPPVQITTSPNHHQSKSPPVQITTSPNHHQSKSPPVQITSSPNHFQSKSPPVQITTSPNDLQFKSPPVQITTSSNHHLQSKSPPVQITSSPNHLQFKLYQPFQG